MYFKYFHCGVFIVLVHISTYLYQPICYYLVLFYYLTKCWEAKQHLHGQKTTLISLVSI